MRNFTDTIARLAAQRGTSGQGMPRGSRLTDLSEFGSNPGALRARIHIPESLADDAALVVVLHGCTQTAEGYDTGSGWSDMADRHGFALLFPEQQRQNNPQCCFNWFSPDDSRREGGEAFSIRQMIAAMIEAYAIDPTRVFVTGLSAGGAMASVMLATYPEVFAGGAIIAGLPYGSATSIPQAFDRMRGQGVPGEEELTALVRGASDHAGPWPVISIWHGSGDATVNPTNADAIIRQWRVLHGVGTGASRQETVDGYPRRVWCDGEGRDVIEEYSITGMGHGTPLDTMREDGCGRSGAFMLEASISSTHHICRFWGLTEDAAAIAQDRSVDAPHAPQALVPAAGSPAAHTAPPFRPHARRPERVASSVATGVGKVIEDALRAAGLMR